MFAKLQRGKIEMRIGIPAVFPIVLYNGVEPRRAKLSLREITDQGERFGEAILNFRYSLLDVNHTYTEADLLSNDCISFIILLDQIGDAILKLIFSTLRRHLALFCAGIFFLTLEAFCDLLQPALMSHIVDDGVKRQAPRTILMFGGLMLTVAALGACGAILRNILSSHVSQRAAMELRSRLYRKVQSYSFANIGRFPPATLVTLLTNDVTQIQHFINGLMRILVKAPVTCVGAIVLIVTRTPRLTPVLAAILTVCALLIALNMLWGYPRFGRLQRRLDQLNRVSREFLGAIRVVKSFGREDAEEARFGAAAESLAAASVSAMHVAAFVTPLLNFTVNAGIVALFWLADAGPQQDVGRLMASVNYMTQMTFSLAMVSSILNTMVRASASAGRIQAALDEVPAMMPPPRPQTAASCAVTFSGVRFTYPQAGHCTLRDISFSVQNGLVGIIGPTGSGKSTLLQLIPRFYDVDSGAVLVGGVDVRHQDWQPLRAMTGVVPQRAVLFSGTVRENLLWGDETASDEMLWQAARTACADGFIRALPCGYDTVLGQGGVNLSGGQKQRLCLARALVRRPRLLLLDDCTSALDAATEATVLDGLRTYAESATVLLVSQRIATVMRAGHILCLDNGMLCGQGSHAQLMADCVVYREIYRSQIGGDGNG